MQTDIAQTVTFGVEGDAADWQLYGFHRPEDGFTWMNGLESALMLPAPEAPYGLFIEVRAFSCRQDEIVSQPLTVTVNGQSTGGVCPVIDGTYAWYVPPQPPELSRLTITLGHPTPIARREAGGRDLSIALRRLRIAVLREPAVSAADRKFRTEPTHQDAEAKTIAEYLTDLPVFDLVNKFENFGDDCEVGLVQRRCGAEPLGLFRFCTLHLPCALRAVESDFQGMGNQLSVALEDNDGEWMARENGYLMRWHTFLRKNDTTHEQLFAREQKKLVFLIRKMRSDIAGGSKIFVVKSRDAPAPVEQVIPLHLAMNRCAPNWLLWVTVADARHPVGLVEEIHPRLFCGYIDRFTIGGAGDTERIPVWMGILAGAWLLRNR